MIGALVRLILLIFVISVVVRLGILAFLISVLANGGWGSSPEASGSFPLAAKSWCMGLVTQIEAREVMGNAGALRQIPPIRQQFIERNCQAYGLRMP